MTIPDIIGQVVTAIQENGKPYFMYGHRMEIANRLLEKDKDRIYKYQKYPLVALRLPITETISEGIIEASLNIAFLEFTDKNYIASERYQNVISPVLFPIYSDFMTALRDHKEVLNVDLEYEKTDRLFWGVSEGEGNVKYIFNDPLDGIELTNLKIKILNLNC